MPYRVPLGNIKFVSDKIIEVWADGTIGPNKTPMTMTDKLQLLQQLYKVNEELSKLWGEAGEIQKILEKV